MIEIHLYAFMCALIGFVYSMVLTEPGQIFNPLYRFLDRKIGRFEFIFKPLIDCFKCVSGQIALFSGVFLIPNNGELMRIFTHVYYICLTIFISIIINKIYDSIKNN